MTTIRETCSCGATWQIDGSEVAGPTHDWRGGHRHEFPPPSATEPSSAGDITTAGSHTGHVDTGLGFTTPALTTEDA